MAGFPGDSFRNQSDRATSGGEYFLGLLLPVAEETNPDEQPVAAAPRYPLHSADAAARTGWNTQTSALRGEYWKEKDTKLAWRRIDERAEVPFRDAAMVAR
jgi:hypothetical protein